MIFWLVYSLVPAATLPLHTTDRRGNVFSARFTVSASIVAEYNDDSFHFERWLKPKGLRNGLYGIGERNMATGTWGHSTRCESSGHFLLRFVVTFPENKHSFQDTIKGQNWKTSLREVVSSQHCEVLDEGVFSQVATGREAPALWHRMRCFQPKRVKLHPRSGETSAPCTLRVSTVSGSSTSGIRKRSDNTRVQQKYVLRTIVCVCVYVPIFCMCVGFKTVTLTAN